SRLATPGDRAEVPAVAAAEIEHAAREAGDDLADAPVVAGEDVDGRGLPGAGAARARGAGGALAGEVELAEGLGKVVGGELLRDVEVELAERLLDLEEIDVGEIARLGAEEAEPILEADEE